jgi:hypothetical protein
MSLVTRKVSGTLTPVGESDDPEAGAINAVYDAEWKAPERKSPIALVERFANIR